jgi:threonine synthase
MSLEKKTVIHRCVRCGKLRPHEFVAFCECGGMIDTEYALDRARLHDSRNPLVRFFDLLPIEDPGNLLPVELPTTPCIHATRLGEAIGMPRLYLKDETKNPTRTTKDRMAAVALSYMKECGIREFCTSSTGNSSSSFAHFAMSYPGCRIYLFTAEDFADRVLGTSAEQVVHFVLRGATFVEAFACAAEYATRTGLPSERGFFNPGRREGLKLAFLEATDQIEGPIDWYVQAVSSAMGVYGSYKGARELVQMGKIARPPRLLCVQQETCAPLVRAFLEGSPECRADHVVARPFGIAKAILRGDPRRVYPYVRDIVLESKGTMSQVSEAEIREARTMILELEGVDACFSASAAFAGLLKLVRNGAFPREDTVLVNLTGGDRPDDTREQAPHLVPYWLRRKGEHWEPEDPSDPRTPKVWPT